MPNSIVDKIKANKHVLFVLMASISLIVMFYSASQGYLVPTLISGFLAGVSTRQAVESKKE
jgi:hypothetical protein